MTYDRFYNMLYRGSVVKQKQHEQAAVASNIRQAVVLSSQAASSCSTATSSN